MRQEYRRLNWRIYKMQKILRRRVFRDLKENFLRYFALALLIILGMYIVVSLVGAAETIITGVDKAGERNCLEDGQFTVFQPLTEGEKERLEKAGASTEEMFYLDFAGEEDSILRVFKNRESMNLIQVEKGSLAGKDNEIVVEKRYSEQHQIVPGDEIMIGGETFTVTGIGTTPDYDAPYKNLSDSSVDSDIFGTVFVTEEAYERLKESGNSAKTEEYLYAFRLQEGTTAKDVKKELQEFTISADKVDDVYFQEYWEELVGDRDELTEGIDELVDGSLELKDGTEALTEEFVQIASYIDGMQAYTDGVVKLDEGAGELAEGMEELQEKTDEFVDEYLNIELKNMTQFLSVEDNPRVRASAEDQVINKFAGLLAGVIAMVLFTYVISVFVIHGIEQESSVIGALYALGAKKKDLMFHYLLLPVVITFAAGIIGTAIGYSKWGINVQMGDCYEYFSIPEFSTGYSGYLLLYGIVMPPVVAAIVNCFVIRKRLGQPVLKLMRNEQGNNKVSNIQLKNMGFIGKFRIRQMLREMRCGFTVVFGMFISMLIMMLGVNCYVLCEHISVENKEDTKFEYMYTYKYPEEKVPEGGEACYVRTLKKEVLGYNLDVTLMGIDSENPYFEAEVEEGKNRMVVSSAMSQKYGIKAGDKIILSDEEADMDYAFTVDGVTQFATGLYAFMDIDSMRELFGEDEDYYNVVLADKELPIETGRLYSTTTKAEIEKSSSVFVEMMVPMVVMMISVSILIFCVVMYLMLKVMLDRQAFSISLMKIFGYRKGEIRKLYLNGNFYIIAVGAAICIPLSKKMMDSMYPMMISNISTGMNLTFTPQLYIGIYVGVIVLYFLINQMLVGRIKKMVPAEVLKNRE